jgi:hypothetical protein
MYGSVYISWKKLNIILAGSMAKRKRDIRKVRNIGLMEETKKEFYRN